MMTKAGGFRAMAKDDDSTTGPSRIRLVREACKGANKEFKPFANLILGILDDPAPASTGERKQVGQGTKCICSKESGDNRDCLLHGVKACTCNRGVRIKPELMTDPAECPVHGGTVFMPPQEPRGEARTVRGRGYQ